MSAPADPVLSALVVLEPAGPPPGPAMAGRVRAHFESEGFEVSQIVADGFSITGRRSLFLGRLGPSGAPDAALRGEREGLALPLESLPASLAGAVRTVTFTPPPDFGPGNP